jgi:glucosamine--fructose-6-phosphate aminotransferase (isomerizing)
MCGIVGIVGNAPVTSRLVDGLRRLEYRGYDSSGIAVLTNNVIERRRAQGKIHHLESLVANQPVDGRTGIAHTRWATHGVPSEANAHPHATAKATLVHNGIIENHTALRQELQSLGYQFTSQTDTEVAVHLLTHYLNQGMDPVSAAQAMVQRLQGTYALAILFTDHPHLMIGARQGSPLAVGYGDNEMFLGSDALAVAPLSQRIAYLDDGDVAVLTPTTVTIYNRYGQAVEREVQQSRVTLAMLGKGNHRHFMLKEIFEQPAVIADTLSTFLDEASMTIQLPALPWEWTNVSRLTIVACGTSYYAGLVAKYWFETWTRLPVEVDIASEFRYRQPPMEKGGVALFISQSGETADTLAAAQYAKSQGQIIAAVVNVPESSLTRVADITFHTLAGVEIGVASTKAFTAQLTVLAALAITAGRVRNVLDKTQAQEVTQALVHITTTMREVLQKDTELQTLGTMIAEARDVLFLGRGTSYPMALEGALKLKEISYIHAEGYAAGEMKHGPIALIDDHVPIIVLAPSDSLLEKTLSNLEESRVRGGKVLLLTDAAGLAALGSDKVWASFVLPTVHPFVTPLLYAVPLQLLAYFTALAKGTDIDQPRNLAKSVTVE